MDHRSYEREPSFFRPSLVPSPIGSHTINNSNPGATGTRVPPPAHGGSVVKRHGTTSATSSQPLVDHRSLTPDSRMGKDTPVAAGLWRPPSLSPKHHRSPLMNAGPSSIDGRTSAPPAAHQSSSSLPAGVIHHLPIGHLPPPPLPPPQRISSSPSSSASSIHVPRPRPQNASSPQKDGRSSLMSSSVLKPGNPSVGLGILRSDPQVTRQQQLPKEFVTSSSQLIQSSPSHHIYSPIPGYSVNGHLTSGPLPLPRANGSSNGPPGMMTIPSSSHNYQPIATNSKSSFLSVDSLISNSSNSRSQELGHLKQLHSTATAKPADNSSKTSQPETSGNHWSPSNNNRSRYSSPIHRLPIPGFGPPGVVALSGHALQSGMVISSSQPSSHFQPLPQYHPHPHLSKAPVSSGTPLITPPAAHQSLPNSQGINSNESGCLISSINSGNSRTQNKMEGKKSSIKSQQQQSEETGQRSTVLSFPPGGHFPLHFDPRLHVTPTTVHATIQHLGHHPYQSVHHPVQLRPPPQGINSQQHNLLPGSCPSSLPSSIIQHSKGGSPCDNSSRSNNTSFSSLSNHHSQQHQFVVNRSVNNGNNQSSLQCHDPATVLFDGSKKGRKSESGSMNENSCDNQIPSTSVSPTNSNHSSHSNSGAAKSLKKFWVQKYQDTNSSTGNGNDVTKNMIDRPIGENASSVSPGNGSTDVLPASGMKDNAPDKGKETGKKVKGEKALKTMKSGIKLGTSSHPIDSSGGDAGTGSESDMMSGTEIGKKEKVKKQKKDDTNESITSKSGTKRPAAGKETGSKKVGGKKKKVDGGGIEGESDCSSIQEAGGNKKKKKSKELVAKGNNKSCQEQQLMDSEMTDVEEEESSPPNCGVKVTTPSNATATGVVPGKRGRKPKLKGKVGEKTGDNSNNDSSEVQEKGLSVKAASTTGSGSEGGGGSSSGTGDKQGKKMREKYTAELMMNKSGQPFLQSKSCSEIAPTKSTILTRCRECKMTPYQKLKKEVGPSIFCRFYQFRKLFFHKELRAAGFSEPFDAKEEDFKLWIPPDPTVSRDTLKKKDARFLIDFVSDHFCTLVTQERRALSIHKGPNDSVIAWKSVVAGVREMCDVCDTTLFNIHWVCSECGFVVCIDCYKSKIDDEDGCSPSKEVGSRNSCDNSNSSPIVANERGLSKDRDKFNWLLCNTRQPHSQEKLMLTQIIAKSALWEVCARLHNVKKLYLKQECKCSNDSSSLQRLIKAQALLNSNKQNGIPSSSSSSNGSGIANVKLEASGSTTATGTSSPLSLLADVAINCSSEKGGTGDTSSAASTTTDDDEDKNFSALRELLSKPAPPSGKGRKGKKNQTVLQATQLNGVLNYEDEAQSDDPTKLNFFTRKVTPLFISKNLPPRVCTLKETQKEFPDIPHEWVCDGRLLVLKDTGIDKNLLLFEQQWLRHQPVVVCKVQDWLEKHYWTPKVFNSKYAEAKYDLIDTETHDVVKDQPLKKYWDGFENLKNRPKTESKNGSKYVTYKLKDWPPGEEFSEALPEQYRDLMSCIPLPEYTTHEGTRNLAARLPRSFGLIPDLGPKMYTAYGLASDEMGTTNLHLDVSDAVNVMVYVGTLKSKDDEKEHQKNVMKALEDAGVEVAQMKRTKEKKERVGALWHIYDSRDADKIRDMLNRVSIERGIKLEKHHDPIHDQSFYLDKKLRERLKKDYGVEGYQIVQFYGDSVFIPAGAPHQVRNLSSCIKVAEDFVSPENVAHCFNLTEEFRQLSGSHENHEDKLQIKNIIYHTIKDALAAYPNDKLDWEVDEPSQKVVKKEDGEEGTENKV